MSGLNYDYETGIIEVIFEHSGRRWTGIGATENEAVVCLLTTMAIDLDFAAHAPFGLDIEEFLGECAGHNDSLASEVERLTDRIEELEVLNAIMAQQYGANLAELIEQRDHARHQLTDAKIKIANLVDRLDLQELSG